MLAAQTEESILHKKYIFTGVYEAGRPAASRESTELERLRQRVQAKLDELHRDGEFPGATASFVLADGRYASVSAGWSDLESRRALVPSDRMLAGSTGKTYVAAVVMQLVGEGKLRLDDKIEGFFERDQWFPRLPNARSITLRMLLNHTSGVPEHVLNGSFIEALRRGEPDRVWKPEELIDFVLDAQPLFPAGRGWSYADTNYILVGMIVERATGKSVYDEVSRRILRPLKLRQTSPSVSRVIPGLVTGYSMPNSPFGFEGRVVVDDRFIINPQFEWTGGGFVSTAGDLARWAKALYEGKAFKRSLLEEMLAGAVEAKTGRGDRYGLGVQVRESEWGVSYGHGGWFPGYLTEMEYFPQTGVAIAVQFNTDAARKLKRSPRGFIAEIARVIASETGSRTSKRRATAN